MFLYCSIVRRGALVFLLLACPPTCLPRTQRLTPCRSDLWWVGLAAKTPLHQAWMRRKEVQEARRMDWEAEAERQKEAEEERNLLAKDRSKGFL